MMKHNGKTPLPRAKLIQLVSDIMDCKGTEEEIDQMLTLLTESVPHPQVSDLIFWPEQELTPEQIVDAALAYRPIQL